VVFKMKPVLVSVNYVFAGHISGSLQRDSRSGSTTNFNLSFRNFVATELLSMTVALKFYSSVNINPFLKPCPSSKATPDYIRSKRLSRILNLWPFLK
jgi:hypothetical protein